MRWNVHLIRAMSLVACLLLVLLSLHPSVMFGFQSSGDEHYVMMAIGEKIGDLRVKTTGRHIDIDFKVDDNGRGPKYEEKVDLDPHAPQRTRGVGRGGHSRVRCAPSRNHRQRALPGHRPDHRNCGASKMWDVILVEGDPIKDISAVRKVKLVMKGNTIYFPDEIYTALGITPFVEQAKVATNV